MLKKCLPALIFFISFTACAFIKPDYLKTLSPPELNQIIQKGDIFLVDVHVPEQRHIKGTDAFIPYNKIEENIGRFPENKETPVYLYCKGGPMANAAARSLYKSGYSNIYNLKGGMDAWIKAGYSVK